MKGSRRNRVQTTGSTAPDNLTDTRKNRGFTQQTLTEAPGIHITQLRRYEAGTSQPTLDVLNRIAASPIVSIDSLANDDNDLPQDLRRHFEAINQLDPDEQTVIRTLIEATLIRHQARKIAS